MKDSLIKRLNKTKHNGDIYTELDTYGCRADVVLLKDDTFHAWECKSDSDTLKRFIEEQRWGYSYFFDYVTLVITPKHLVKALALLEAPTPLFKKGCIWGLMLSDGKVVKEPKLNMYRKDLHLLRKLWKRDLLTEFKKRKIKGYSKLSCWEMRKLLLANLAPDEIRKLVRFYILEHKTNPFTYE